MKTKNRPDEGKAATYFPQHHFRNLIVKMVLGIMGLERFHF